jgi:deoxyribonuclease IV
MSKYPHYDKLNFGTAGIPLSTPDRNIGNGIVHIKNLGLSAMELEFVHSVNVSAPKAPAIADMAKANGVELTCHGQYFINLNSLEEQKIKDSVIRILNAANIANMCGARSLTFHAAYYMKLDKNGVYETVKKQLKEIINKLKEDGNPIMIRPETTGKDTQFGTVEEIIKLGQDIEQILPCVDFSHLHARTNGKFNTKKEFDSVLEKIEAGLGKEAIQSMHIHVSGINYSEKGERNHLILKESDFNYQELMQSLKDFGVRGALVCESPNLEDDAKLLKRTYEQCR